MSIGWDNNYEKIEKTEIIYKIIINGNYEITKYIGVGIFFAPFITGSIDGFNTGIYLSFGKLWQSNKNQNNSRN
jgi:hypothetical protein